MRFLKSLFSRQPESVKRPAFDAALQPENPLLVVGDVHGMAGLLDRLLDKLEKQQPKDAQLVLVGDLVDRGENSNKVLDQVQALVAEGAICLMGNHERMMLDFLDKPESSGQRWLRNGGLQTLMSYGVGGVTTTSGADDLVKCRDALLERIKPEQVTWLRNLPTVYSSGNVHVVHAAADPDLPVQMQSEGTLLWGHGDFGQVPRTDGQWIVHGHTIVDTPVAKGGVISTDTGAFATGKLTAAIIQSGDVEFVQT